MSQCQTRNAKKLGTAACRPVFTRVFVNSKFKKVSNYVKKVDSCKKKENSISKQKMDVAPKGHSVKIVNNGEHVYNVRTNNRFWPLSEHNSDDTLDNASINGL